MLYQFKHLRESRFMTFSVILIFSLVSFILISPNSRQTSTKFIVNQNHPGASDENPGTKAKPFKTIGKAATLAQPGDTIFVHEGIYREWVAPARGGKENLPITYLGAPNEKVIVTGSEIYQNNWLPVSGHERVYYTKIPVEFFSSDFNPFKIVFSESRGGGRQGQIFIDGKEIFETKIKKTDSKIKTDSAKSKIEYLFEQPGTWTTDDGETIYIHLSEGSKTLENSIVEFSVRRHLFAPVHRAQNYINLKGFIFEHCANDASFPQVGAVSCRSGQHWLIENNIIRNIKTIGLDFGAEDEDPWKLPDILPEDRFFVGRHHDIFTLSERRIAGRHLILNNIISDCGQCGMAGLFSDGTVIMGNTVERCGSVVPGFETGGIKVHGLMGGTVEGNLVRDNESWGIWLDCGYIGSRVTRNVVINNKISGIFFECSNGPGLIDNNIIAYNRGDGIYCHDASGIMAANNFIFGNDNFGIYMCVATNRLVPPYHYATGLFEDEISSCSWERIFNNIIVENREGAISLPYPSQRAQDNFSDYNLLSGPSFVQHFRNGEQNVNGEAIDKALKAFQESGDAGLSSKDLVKWKNDKGILMDLSQWQLSTGNDKNSFTADVTAQLDLNTFDLTVNLNEDINKLKCNPVETLKVRDFKKFSRQIDKDFMMQPMTSKVWLPGAFQNFKGGKNKVRVWPVMFMHPDMPPKVAVLPEPGSPGLNPVPAPDNNSGY